MQNSFGNDSWETIVAAFNDGSYKKIYNIGDTKEVDMGEFGIPTVRIANLPDESHKEFCSNENNSQTACGVVIEFADIITTHSMNPSGTYKGTYYDTGWNVDGYPASSMHEYITNTIYPALPEDLKNAIIPTTVVSSHGKSDTNPNRTDGNWESTDKLYLLSPTEVWGQSWTDTINYFFDEVDYAPAKTTTRQLDYYAKEGVTTINYYKARKHYVGHYKVFNYLYETNGYMWHLRSADTYYTDSFLNVAEAGDWNVSDAKSALGVSPAFRLKAE